MSEIETKIEQPQDEVIEHIPPYSWEDIIIMFDGYEYFDKCQLKYVYHHLNKHEEKAKYYLSICLRNHNKIMEQSLKMKATELQADIDDEKKSVEI
jgi:hypothetical protein